MRIAALAALVLVIAGCSTTTDQQSRTAPASAPDTSAAASSTTGSAGAGPTPGTPFAEVDSWVRAGHQVDAAQYATATTPDGAVTPLKGDAAFTSPTGKIKCTTDSEESMPGLSCLVDLTNPPPKPTDGGEEGEFVANWIDFTGTEASVGSMHGDPGPFVRGYGNKLAYGSRITTGDYTCRIDSTGLICADETTKSAIKMSDAGIVPFGCLHRRKHAPGVGEQYGC